MRLGFAVSPARPRGHIFHADNMKQIDLKQTIGDRFIKFLGNANDGRSPANHNQIRVANIVGGAGCQMQAEGLERLPFCKFAKFFMCHVDCISPLIFHVQLIMRRLSMREYSERKLAQSRYYILHAAGVEAAHTE